MTFQKTKQLVFFFSKHKTLLPHMEQKTRNFEIRTIRDIRQKVDGEALYQNFVFQSLFTKYFQTFGNRWHGYCPNTQEDFKHSFCDGFEDISRIKKRCKQTSKSIGNIKMERSFLFRFGNCFEGIHDERNASELDLKKVRKFNLRKQGFQT